MHFRRHQYTLWTDLRVVREDIAFLMASLQRFLPLWFVSCDPLKPFVLLLILSTISQSLLGRQVFLET